MVIWQQATAIIAPYLYTAHMLHQNGAFLFTAAQPKINCQGLHTTASSVKILILKKLRASLAPRTWKHTAC